VRRGRPHEHRRYDVLVDQTEGGLLSAQQASSAVRSSGSRICYSRVFAQRVMVLRMQSIGSLASSG
jgi:hypothetical protein